jgi:hypothetical protein
MNTIDKAILIDVFKRTWKYLLIVVIIILLYKQCNQQPQLVTKIVTKEVKGKFQEVKPIHDTILITRTLTNSKEDKFLQGQIEQLIKENKGLTEYFNEASDSVRLLMYERAVELKSFAHTFENDTIKATTSGIVQGEVKSIKLDYTIKPQTIEIPKPKEKVFSLLAGGGFGIDTELRQPIYKANLGFQNKKGNVYFASFQRIGSNDFITAEINFNIFSIKK